MARGGVIGRIGPEMTPECDCTAGAGGAAGVGTGAAGAAGLAGAGAGAVADLADAGLAAGCSAAFGACTSTDAVTLGVAAALAAGLAAGFTPGSAFAAVLGAAGGFGVAGFSANLGFMAEVNFFTVTGLGGDLRWAPGFDEAPDLGSGFPAIAGFAGFEAGGGGALPLPFNVPRLAAVLSPLFLPPMLKTPEAPAAAPRSISRQAA